MAAPVPVQSFPDTRWSVVTQAARGDEPEALAAMAELYLSYWYPLYGYARRDGLQPADAEDAVQEFLSINARSLWGQADPRRGRLRSFLLVCFNRWLTEIYRHQHRARRGGHAVHIPFEADGAESRYRQEPADHRTPESVYHQAWARELITGALRQLARERMELGKEREFEILAPFLAFQSPLLESYRAPAQALGLTENAVAVSVFRLRRRYRHLIRKTIADTMVNPTPDEIESEWLELRRLLGE